MKRIIENDFLKVTIDDHGAELVSIYDKEKDREVIWQGDPKFWGRHAPVLFPNVGKHYEQPLSHSRDRNMLPSSTDLPGIRISPALIPHRIP